MADVEENPEALSVEDDEREGEIDEKSEQMASQEPALSADEIEKARIDAMKEEKRQERLKMDTPANLARVDFEVAQPKHIVSHHAGSILAREGPVVPLTDDMLEKAKEVFKEMAISFDDPEGDQEEEESELAGGESTEDGSGGEKKDRKEKVNPPPVIEANRLAQALYRCGATPINTDSIPQLTGVSGVDSKQEEAEEQERTEDDGNAGGDGDGDGGDGVTKSAPVDRRTEILKRAIALFADGNSREKSGASEEKNDDMSLSKSGVPMGSMEEADFLNFVSEFFAPSYYYGQRLRRFVARGCVDDALLLLARGCNVNTSDGEGLSSLHYAAEFNRTEMIKQLHAFSKDSLKINAKDKAGWTPLYCAVHHGSLEAVETLLDSPLNADVSAATLLGKVPLHAAAGQGRLAIANILLAKGADASVQDFQGMTPLHDAAYKLHEELYELIKGHETCGVDVREELGYVAEDFFNGRTGVAGEQKVT